jgi:DNA-binding transcriptional LysR family regulator
MCVEIFSYKTMDLNQLKTFYTLAQTKNYSKCAQKLFVTQSAVSHAIKKLETSLDEKLVKKVKNRFSLTQEGELLFKTCQTVFFELDNVQDKLNENKDNIEVIRLGSPVEFGVSILLKNINPFLKNNPKIHIDFTLKDDLIKSLLDDELDMIIDCKHHINPELKKISLFREEYAVIASPVYIEENKISRITDLKKCNVISLDKQLVWWSNFINAIPLENRVEFKTITEINHIRGIINATISSVGIGFVPTYTVLKELKEGILEMLFPELTLFDDHFNIFIKRKRSVLKKNITLINYIKKFKLD